MRDEILKVFRKWLFIDDEIPLDIVMATALAALFPGDPVWTLLCSSPGGGKTEMVRALSGPYVYSLDSLTTKTLVSGLKDKKSTQKFGILPDLDGKLLVIKDLTVMLQGAAIPRPEENVFTQLRAAYDGEYAAAHGSGHKRQYYKTKFGVIAAVTPIVDRYRVMNSALGERFLTIRIHQNSNESIKKAQENCGKEELMRAELQLAMKSALDYYKSMGTTLGIPMLDTDIMTKIQTLGEITAKLRTEVDRDWQRVVTSLPETEVGTRLVKQLTRLGEMLKLYDAFDYSKLVRVCRDSLNRIREKVARTVFEDYKVTPWDVHRKVGLSYPTIRDACEDLFLLSLCDKEEKGRTPYYSYKPEVLELILKSELF